MSMNPSSPHQLDLPMFCTNSERKLGHGSFIKRLHVKFQDQPKLNDTPTLQ